MALRFAFAGHCTIVLGLGAWCVGHAAATQPVAVEKPAASRIRDDAPGSQDYEVEVEGLAAHGRHAVSARDVKPPEQFAQATRPRKTANAEGEKTLTAGQKLKAVSRSRTPNEAPATTRDVDFLGIEQNLRTIRAQKLSKEVARTIDAAQKTARLDADAAVGELKRTLTTVVSSNDIDPDLRERLRVKVLANMEQVLTLKQKVDQDRILRIERMAAVQARELATEQLLQRDEQIEQLIDKVRSLITEGYLGNAEAFERAEEVARASFELAPYSGVTSAAIFDSEAAGQLDKAQRLRYLRYDKVLAALHQVELSHVPFPDEPPILYPAPEVWKALTERRQKWASVDLVRYNPTEEKIRKSLSKPTTVEFLDLPLEDCITFLKEYHNINIWLDRATLTDEGVALDQPITLKLAGVTLRSVLKLLLEPVQLTYVIEDEVMKITTSAKAGEKLQTRVYPVGDLVIPITTPRAGRGGMGMMGGMGGGMGGMGMGGGMMGGMGGMGGGMMGGGMGMGMMNVGEIKSARDDVKDSSFDK